VQSKSQNCDNRRRILPKLIVKLNHIHVDSSGDHKLRFYLSSQASESLLLFSLSTEQFFVQTRISKTFHLHFEALRIRSFLRSFITLIHVTEV
jgi:hypothetical protein